MGGMEACIDVRREIRVLAWVAGAEVLLAVMFQFYPHGPQLGTDPLNLGYLFGRWMCAVEAVALVRQVGHMDRLAKKLSGLDGYLRSPSSSGRWNGYGGTAPSVCGQRYSGSIRWCSWGSSSWPSTA